MLAWRHSPLSERIPRGYLVRSFLVLPWLLLSSSINISAGPLVSNDPPIAFFTNVASRLLQSQLNLSLTRIQIYPTNHYTPSVHRLLQLTANIYDATTDRSFAFKNPVGYPAPAFPAVFKPKFQSFNGGNEICISGYAAVT